MALPKFACLSILAAACMSTYAFAQQPSEQQQPGNSQSGQASQTPAEDLHQSQTERVLNASEREDSGRALSWVYLDVEGGFEYVALEAIKSDSLTYGDISSSSPGFVAGVGLGVRLLVFTFGARGRFGMFQDWKLGSIGGEAGLRLPLGSIEPYFTIGAGYVFLTSLDNNAWGGNPSIRGLGANLGAGVDYYPTSVFSIGAKLAGDMLFLFREAVDAQSPSLHWTERMKANQVGRSIGLGFSCTLVLGLHF